MRINSNNFGANPQVLREDLRQQAPSPGNIILPVSNRLNHHHMRYLTFEERNTCDEKTQVGKTRRPGDKENSHC